MKTNCSWPVSDACWECAGHWGACDGGCGPPVQNSMTKEEKSAADATLTPEEGLPTIPSVRDTSVMRIGSPFSLHVGCFCEGLKGDSSSELGRSSVAAVLAS